MPRTQAQLTQAVDKKGVEFTLLARGGAAFSITSLQLTTRIIR